MNLRVRSFLQLRIMYGFFFRSFPGRLESSTDNFIISRPLLIQRSIESSNATITIWAQKTLQLQSSINFMGGDNTDGYWNRLMLVAGKLRFVFA